MPCQFCPVCRLQSVADQVQQGLHAPVASLAVDGMPVYQGEAAGYPQAEGMFFFHVETAVPGENYGTRLLQREGRLLPGILVVIMKAFRQLVHRGTQKPQQPVLIRNVERGNIACSPADSFRYPDIHNQLLRRAEACSRKLKGDTPVVVDFFVLHRLFRTAYGAVVYLPVSIEIVEACLILGVTCGHNFFKIFHSIPHSFR